MSLGTLAAPRAPDLVLMYGLAGHSNCCGVRVPVFVKTGRPGYLTVAQAAHLDPEKVVAAIRGFRESLVLWRRGFVVQLMMPKNLSDLPEVVEAITATFDEDLSPVADNGIVVVWAGVSSKGQP